MAVLTADRPRQTYSGDRYSTENQRILDIFVKENVCANITDMARYLFDIENGCGGYATWDDWDNMYHSECPECGEDVLEWDEPSADETESTWAGKCPHCGTVYDIAPDMELQEVAEYWLVTKFLGRRLRDLGHPVFERWGHWIWGRRGSGQAISLDSVITQIAFDLAILDGMPNSKWYKEAH